MKVLFDENGYIKSFILGEGGCFGDDVDAVELPDPEDVEHFTKYHQHYTKEGFNQSHLDDSAVQQECQKQIDELKARLAATDYKVIKCMESKLMGKELPYDIVSIHAERQSVRDLINTLENDYEVKKI